MSFGSTERDALDIIKEIKRQGSIDEDAINDACSINCVIGFEPGCLRAIETPDDI
jgi:hypothetical protein